MVGNAIAQSAQPIISYNFGLGYKERVMTAERIALLTAVVCGVVATVAFTVYPYLLVGLFISLDSEAAKIAIHGFPYFASGFVFFIVNIAVVGYFQSVERIKPATIFSLCCVALFSLFRVLFCCRSSWVCRESGWQCHSRRL